MKRVRKAAEAVWGAPKDSMPQRGMPAIEAMSLKLTANSL